MTSFAPGAARSKGAAWEWAMRDGAFYGSPAVSAGGTGTLTNQRLMLTPIWVPRPVTLDRIAARTITAGEASSVLRLGLYDANDAFQATDLVFDAGTVPGDSTGFHAITIDQEVGPGLKFLASVLQGAPSSSPTFATMTVHNLFNVGYSVVGQLGENTIGWRVNSTAGSLPSALSAVDLQHHNAIAPVVLVRVAA